MRCPKCGYFSFDHHDTCAKCDKELTDVRQELNLQDFQPEVPFLLGSLVGDMEFAAGGGEQGLSLTQETEMALSGVDTSGPITMEGTMDMQGMEQTLDADAVGDVELDEIALDDLEGIDAGEIPLADGAEIELEGLSGEGDVAEGPAGDDEELRGLELDMEDLEETLAGGDASEFELTPSDEPADASAEDTLALELDAEPEIDTASEEPMLELNLDDDDLSALADELEDELGSEAKADAPKPEGSASGQLGSEVDFSDDDLSALADELEESIIAESGEKKRAGTSDPASDLDEVILDLEEE